MTTDGQAARVWLTEHLEAGVEGVVAKRLDHAYSPKRAWRKVRTRTSAEAVVGGVLGPIAAPVALVLGRPDVTGRLRVVGRTGPIHRDVRPALGAVLRPAGEGHPWPAVLPPARFGDVGPVEYTRVEPSVVVELAVDAAVDNIRGPPACGAMPRGSSGCGWTFGPTICRQGHATRANRRQPWSANEAIAWMIISSRSALGNDS
jgi:hypothetical protein